MEEYNIYGETQLLESLQGILKHLHIYFLNVANVKGNTEKFFHHTTFVEHLIFKFWK